MTLGCLTDESSLEALCKAFHAFCGQASENLGEPWLQEPALKQHVTDNPREYVTHWNPLIRKVAEAQISVLLAREQKCKADTEEGRAISLAEARSMVAKVCLETSQASAVQMQALTSRIANLETGLSEGKAMIKTLVLENQQLKEVATSTGALKADVRKMRGQIATLASTMNGFLDTLGVEVGREGAGQGPAFWASAENVRSGNAFGFGLDDIGGELVNIYKHSNGDANTRYAKGAYTRDPIRWDPQFFVRFASKYQQIQPPTVVSGPVGNMEAAMYAAGGRAVREALASQESLLAGMRAAATRVVAENRGV